MDGLWLNEKEFVSFASQEPPPVFPEIATRRGAIDFYAFATFLPNPDPVLRKLGRDIWAYNDLLVDAHVGACVKSRKAGVKSFNWGIDYGKAKTTRQAKFIDGVISSLDVDRIISEILNAVLFGYQVLEVIWTRDSNGFIVPQDVLGKPQNWFVFDQENNLMLRTRANFNGVLVPDRKFLLVQYESTYQNPYGFPELSRCFWPVTFKKGSVKFWAIFAEKYGMPFIIGKLPRSAPDSDYEKLASRLDAMVQDAVAVIPDDSSVDIQSGLVKGGASSTLYVDLIDFLNNEISKAILGQTLTTQMGTTGSYSASQTHMEVRDDIVLSDKRLVERTFNTLITWITEINFSSGDAPEFSLWADEDVDQALADRDKNLTASMALSGLQLTQKYYQKNYGLEDEDIQAGTAPAAPKGGNQPGGNPPAAFAQAAADTFPDQTAIDNITLSPEQLQAQAEGVLKPIIEMIHNKASYNDILDSLAGMFPLMDTDGLVNMLTQAYFVDEMWGRLNSETN
ncbi:MAG: DUF935 family protein [Nitrospirae bacterium]|nr:DUF935 family protein [Nitrospirota bacterium]